MRISDWSSDVCSSDLVVLAAHRRLLASYPDALLILVPRHPERFDSVHQLCESEGFATVRRSSAQPVTAQTSVLLGDTMGELLFLYALADSAFRSEEHTSELQSLMRISYAVFCLKK